MFERAFAEEMQQVCLDREDDLRQWGVRHEELEGRQTVMEAAAKLNGTCLIKYKSDIAWQLDYLSNQFELQNRVAIDTRNVCKYIQTQSTNALCYSKCALCTL